MTKHVKSYSLDTECTAAITRAAKAAGVSASAWLEDLVMTKIRSGVVEDGEPVSLFGGVGSSDPFPGQGGSGSPPTGGGTSHAEWIEGPS